MVWHLATVGVAFLLGSLQLVLPQRTGLRRPCGRAAMVLMLATALIALFLPARIGPVWLGHFGGVHVLCLLTIWAIPRAWWAARRGETATQQRILLKLYSTALALMAVWTVWPKPL